MIAVATIVGYILWLLLVFGPRSLVPHCRGLAANPVAPCVS